MSRAGTVKTSRLGWPAYAHGQAVLSLLMFLLSTFALQAKEHGGFETPCLSVPRSHSTVTIDGVIGEDEWRYAAEIGNFIGLSSDLKTFAPTEETKLLLQHDSTCLYFAFRMTDQALNKLNLMEDTFAKKHVGDHHPQRDESISIWFAPPARNGVPAKQYWFSVNANNLLVGRGNTVEYARTEEHELKPWQTGGGAGWGSAWKDPGIRRKAATYDGYWVIEIALPLASFNLKPGCSQPWRFNFVRNNVRLHQWSLWIPNDYDIVKRSATAAFGKATSDRWGILRLDNRCPAIRTTCNLTETEKATRTIALSIFSTSHQHVSVHCDYQTGRNGAYRTTETALTLTNENTVVQVPFPADISTLQYRIATQEGGLVFCSPINRLTSSGHLDILAHNAEGFSLFLNGKPLDTHKGLNHVQGSLRPGINVVAVALPPGSIFSAAFTKGPDKIVTDSTWKSSRAAGAGWTGYGYDDSSWISAEATPPVTAHIAGARTIANRTDSDVFLRKVILHDFTVLYPDLRGTHFHLTRNGTYFLTWNGSGYGTLDEETCFNDLRLVLDIPDALTLVGVGTSVPTPFSMAAARKRLDIGVAHTVTTRGNRLRGNERLTRYEIAFSSPTALTPNPTSFFSRKGVVIALKATGDVSDDVSAYYFCTASAGTVQEFPRRLACTILPELNGKAPQSLTTYKAEFELLMVNDEDILRARLGTLRQAGINTVFTYSTSPVFKQMGMKQSWFINLRVDAYHGYHNLAAVDMRDLIRHTPEAQSVTAKGNKGQTPCPAYIVEHPETWTYIEAGIRDIRQRNPSLTELFWDFEFPMTSKRYSCFSPFGIQLFAAKHHITGTLTPDIILHTYKDSWRLFWQDCNARLAGLLQRYAHKHGFTFAVWSAYQDCSSYGVDWKKFAANTDLVYCGYSDSSSTISRTRAIANGRGRPLNGGVLSGDIRFSPTVADMLKTGLYAGGGIHVWTAIPNDGRLHANLAPATRFLADYESFLNSASLCPLGEYAEVEGIAHDNVIVYRCKDQVLIALANPTAGTLKVHIGLKARFRSVMEYFSGQDCTAQRFCLNILPGEARVLQAQLSAPHGLRARDEGAP